MSFFLPFTVRPLWVATPYSSLLSNWIFFPLGPLGRLGFLNITTTRNPMIWLPSTVNGVTNYFSFTKSNSIHQKAYPHFSSLRELTFLTYKYSTLRNKIDLLYLIKCSYLIVLPPLLFLASELLIRTFLSILARFHLLTSFLEQFDTLHCAFGFLSFAYSFSPYTYAGTFHTMGNYALKLPFREIRAFTPRTSTTS